MAGKSLNRVQLIGHLGKDPEVKYTPQGKPVAKFSMATSYRQKDSTGEWKDVVEWHNVVAWERTAEIIQEYAKKGSKIYVEGRLKTDSWDDKKTGTRKYMTNIVVQDVILLGGGSDRDGDGGDAQDNNGFDNTSRSRGGTAVTESNPITDDDVPFISNMMTILECPLSWHKKRYV